MKQEYEVSSRELNQYRKQLRKQLTAHDHKKPYDAEISLGKGEYLPAFSVHPQIMRPEVMTSIHLARYLHGNPKLYKGKRVLDVGAGSGLQGVVMGLNGAKTVVFSDVDPHAIANSRENARNLGIDKRSKFIVSDLFSKIKGKFHLIEFNHPFFEGISVEGQRVKGTMIARSGLLGQFLKEAKRHLFPGGILVMPFYHRAPKFNNPNERAREFGYKAKEVLAKKARTGLQQGPISIYILKPVK